MIHNIRPDYHFGFDVSVGCIFHNRNSFLSIDWEHFYSKDSASKQVASTDMIGPFFEIGPDALPYTIAHGKVVFHFDALNLNYGVFLNFGSEIKANLFCGISGVHLKQTLTSEFSNVDETIVRTIKVPSTFSGTGPRIGFEFSGNICKGFYAAGNTAASLLVGTLQNHTDFEALSPALAGLGITPPNMQSTSVDNRTQVVPAFEGRLGFGYTYTFCRCYDLQIEAGYQAQIYVNAIQSVDIGSEVITPPVIPDTVGVFARTFKTNISSFSLAGPYLRCHLGF